MSRLLLVHSPLVGPASWDLIAPALAEPGREVTIPDLSSTIAAGPPWCSRQAELIARAAAARPAVLVGHSRAGPILAAAGALITQIRGYVFVDARLPFPGQTWMDTRAARAGHPAREMADPDGWLPPGRAGGATRPWPDSSRIPSSASASPRAARRCRWPCSPRRTRRRRAGPTRRARICG
jgi:hypothetical protein